MVSSSKINPATKFFYRAIAFLALFVLSLLPPTNSFGQSCDPAPSGLVSWWRGEGDGFDWLGVHDAILTNGVSFVAAEVGQGFALDGSTGAIDLGPWFNLQTFSIALWVNPSSQQQSLADLIDNNHDSSRSWVVQGLSTGTDFQFLRPTNNAGPSVHFTLTPNTWQFLVITVDQNFVGRVYLNGQLQGSATGPGPINYDGTQFLRLGRHATGIRFFTGSLDEIDVYNRALSDTEISGLYTAGSAGKCLPAVPPSIVYQPTNQTVFQGDPVAFSVRARGGVPLYYQWIFNGTKVNNATNQSFVLANPQPSDSGNYWVVVSNSLGAATSSVASLTVKPTPACLPLPPGLVSWWRGEGNALDFTGGNNGSLVGNMTFGKGRVGQGFFSDGTGGAVSIGNPLNLQLQNFTIEAWIRRADPGMVTPSVGNNGLIFSYGAGGYAFGLSVGGQPLLSRVDSDAITAGPAITDTNLHHVAVTKSGTTVIFYVDGTGYQTSYGNVFVFNTNAAIGARGDSFVNGFWGTMDEVSIYDRALDPAFLSAIYNSGPSGKCTAPGPPGIIVQPANQNATAGSNALFTVLAGGTGTLFYQWQFQGTNITGATNYTLSVTNVQLINVGSYQVIVTNALGAVTSSPAALALASPPIIHTQPQSASVFPGSSAQFLVGVSGTPPFNFQWQRNSSNVPGANSYSLIITNVQTTNIGNYTVVISNSFGAVTSAPATLALNVPPIITNQPVSLSVPAGANSGFTVGVSSPAPLKFQWRFGGSNISGATNSALTLFNVQITNAGSYSVFVSNNFGASTSSIAVLSVSNPVCFPSPAGLVAWWQAEGSAVEVLSNSPGTLIGNATFAPGKVGQAFSFDGSGDAIQLGNPTNLQLQNFTIEAWIKRASSSSVSLGGSDGLVFSYGPSGYGFGLDSSGHLFVSKIGADKPTSTNGTVTDTNFHHVAVTKSGSNLVFYVDGVSFPAPAYVTTYTFTTLPAIGARGDNFSSSFLGQIDELSVYNRALSSNEVAALYNATTIGKCSLALSWTTQPVSQVAMQGSNVTFISATAGTRPVAYQWYLNGAPVVIGTSSSLTLSNLTYFQQGNYSVTASNGAGVITSSNASLTLILAPLLSNGSFENGSAGWILNDIAYPSSPLGIHGAGFNSGFGFFSSAPTDGSFCLTHGFDGNGPGRIRAAFDIALPPSPILLTFSYRAAWDMQNYPGSTQPRTFVITVEPYGGGIGLQTNTILTALPGTADYDTGNLNGSVNLSTFAGTAVRISFDFNIPESFTGPAFFQLDNVSISYSPVPPLIAGNLGPSILLTWPVAFSNFAVQVNNSLSNSSGWTSMATNLNVRGQTNFSLTQPFDQTNRFYRLKSL